MTPRQLSAWCELIEREKCGENARELVRLRVAEHAKKDGFNKFLKKLEENSL